MTCLIVLAVASITAASRVIVSHHHSPFLFLQLSSSRSFPLRSIIESCGLVTVRPARHHPRSLLSSPLRRSSTTVIVDKLFARCHLTPPRVTSRVRRNQEVRTMLCAGYNLTLLLLVHIMFSCNYCRLSYSVHHPLPHVTYVTCIVVCSSSVFSSRRCCTITIYYISRRHHNYIVLTFIVHSFGLVWLLP